jgi:hypothetical protein
MSRQLGENSSEGSDDGQGTEEKQEKASIFFCEDQEEHRLGCLTDKDVSCESEKNCRKSREAYQRRHAREGDSSVSEHQESDTCSSETRSTADREVLGRL